MKHGSDGAGIDVLDAFVVTGLVKSKGDARRLLQQGGLYANGEKLAPDNGVLSASGAIHGQYYVLRKGARDMAIVRLHGVSCGSAVDRNRSFGHPRGRYRTSDALHKSHGHIDA